MSSVSIRDAKNNLTALARRAEQGERITITRRGKPVAELVPPPATGGGIDLAAGDAYLRSLGLSRKKGWIAPDFDDPLPEDFLIAPAILPDGR